MWRPSGTSATPARATSSGAPRSGRAVQEDLAARERHDAHDREQRRRLAGAVRADQPDDLAAVEREAEVPHRGHGAVADLDRPQLEDGRRHG